ncbi:threonine synthase [Candidatus Woesearchaeota archaeon]|nr:threonine synthase [Candidatus Woesearchaeota archaeon]
MVIFECEKCHGPLDLVYDYREIKEQIITDVFLREEIKHWKYWPFYPIQQHDKIVSFKEGGTPLIKSKSEKGYMFKYEGVNPTGSFKDRGSTIEITKVNELNIKKVICASTGNMGASVAAYSARAGIKADIYVPTIATKEKVLQMKAYGANVIRVNGNYEDALNRTKKARIKEHVYLTGDYPYRGEGEKSVGFEIIDQLHWDCPDYIVTPIGNATLIYAIFKALNELKEVKIIKKLPRIVGVQAVGCNPIVKAFESKKEIKAMRKTKTIASAIDCGNPVDGIKALYALRKTRGIALDVTDKEIVNARKDLAQEGIYVEPSGAVSYAGAKKLGLGGEVVCVLTGHGLKDNKVY